MFSEKNLTPLIVCMSLFWLARINRFLVPKSVRTCTQGFTTLARKVNFLSPPFAREFGTFDFQLFWAMPEKQSTNGTYFVKFIDVPMNTYNEWKRFTAPIESTRKSFLLFWFIWFVIKSTGLCQN